MHNRVVFMASGLGFVLATVSAIIFGAQPKTQPPVFNPAPNPYASGIYANGIVESDQSQGENINIYPQISGAIMRVLVAEGATVHRGDPLVVLDATVERAQVEQEQAQADAAHALLEELQAEPRPEVLAVASAQVDNARATLKNAADECAKQQRAYGLDRHAVSRDALDNARNAQAIAAAALEVAERQYRLTKAGAWQYDVANQQRQCEALSRAAAAGRALLEKFTIRAPQDGVVLSSQAAVGSYASPQGVYDSYTQGYDPLIVMGTNQDFLGVRVYVDEILVHRLAAAGHIDAQMFIRGTDTRIPLIFSRIQPYISPKVELSDQRQERVDVRVLPVIFRFRKPADASLYPGLLVDVYIGSK